MKKSKPSGFGYKVAKIPGVVSRWIIPKDQRVTMTVTKIDKHGCVTACDITSSRPGKRRRRTSQQSASGRRAYLPASSAARAAEVK